MYASVGKDLLGMVQNVKVIKSSIYLGSKRMVNNDI